MSSLPFPPPPNNPHTCAGHQVRTQTLVKNAIIQIDAAPFKQWYQQHYGAELGLKKGGEADAAEAKVRDETQGGKGGWARDSRSQQPDKCSKWQQHQAAGGKRQQGCPASTRLLQPG